MITFNKTSIGLAPHHNIEIDNAGAFDGLSTQPQHILLVIEETDKPAAERRPTVPEGTVREKAASTNVDKAREALKLVAPQIDVTEFVLTKEQLKDDASIQEAMKAIPELPFSQIVLSKPNELVLGALKTKVADLWDGGIQLDGHVFVAKFAPISDLLAEAKRRNDPHLTIIPLTHPEDDPAIWAASFAGLVAVYAGDPSRPYQSLVVPGLKTKASNGFRFEERNALLASGVSTWRKQGDAIVVDRLVTTYTETSTGAADPSFRDLNTLQTLSYIRFDLREGLLRDFPRHKLAKDDFPYPGDVLTPKTLKMWLIARYRKLQSQGLVQDPDGVFSKTLRVEVSDKQPGKVDVHIVPYLMGQYQQTQIKLAFKI